MTFSFPWFFRSINAKLITTDNLFLEKILKTFFYFSTLFYRRARKRNFKKEVIIINNFDGDIKMKIDPSRSMGAALYWTGFHEFREFIFLHHFLTKEMVFVDVGSNQGEYSLFAAKRLTQGKVIAFEPLPSIRYVLNENIKLNRFNNILVFDCGLSDHESTLLIHEIENVHEGLATFYPGDRQSKSTFNVPLTSLDNIFETMKLNRLDFIKIDIEGGELKALKGASTVIQKYRPVLMVEINELTYSAAGYGSKDVEVFFESIGYQAYEIMKRGRLKRCSVLPAFGNIIFKPQ